ncbi:phosphopentomutase-like [Oscarella lobularis]|uniref:phosphopentomutase-like n=1 Tax=Oscarella lobularis TaxID=121494 RepID=UPI0033138221
MSAAKRAKDDESDVMNAELNSKLEEWLLWDKNETTSQEMLEIAQRKDTGKLEELLLNRMAFGTAGLRARMGPGYSQMNDLTIVQTTQGFCRYLESKFPESVHRRGVVIGYDARHNSKRFGHLAAAVFLSQGIRVQLFSDIAMTPYVPFSVTHFNAVAGIMVTASHNPKEDNGYKVYWENGAQIVSPHDKEISSHILRNLEPWPSSWDSELATRSDLRLDPLAEINQAYPSRIGQSIAVKNLIGKETKLKFVYTAMHGVGYRFIQRLFDEFHLPNVIPVTEQVDPDPEFPTVKFPNPEEGKSALDLAIKTANGRNATIILANDPDADRLALAEKLPNNQWKVFNGNEIGSLLSYWALYNYKQSNPEGFESENVYMLASTVSSKFIGSMASVEGFQFEETLTGFKWMGNRTKELEENGKTVLFAYEEAIGFMYGTSVLDKDGVSAAAALAQFAIHLEMEGKTLSSKLNELYEKYGYHVSQNSYFICHSKPTIQRIFDRLRKDDKYPRSLGQYRILHVRDLTTGYDDSKPDNKAILPTSKSSQMITFTFENGCVATLRTSGTEPKIKYYTELKNKPGEKVNRDDLIALLDDMVKSLVAEFLQPEVNGLIARSD